MPPGWLTTIAWISLALAFLSAGAIAFDILARDHAAYWFLMQFGMILGFLTSYPVNAWLIRRGIKEAM